MALWSVAFLGSTPIGGPIAGAIAEYFGGRAALVLGAVACLVAAAFGAAVLRRIGALDKAAEAPVVVDPAQPDTDQAEPIAR
jgi:hypothetical protein